MCGIVGLFLKDRSLEPQLGALLARMLEVMTERGPDSAGFAVYGEGGAGRIKLTLRGEDLAGIAEAIGAGATGVLRDPISCKPAVMAETDQYVAFGSEYRALVGLPGIENARVFEPEPARVYAWERN